jgi:hypothetical protein
MRQTARRNDFFNDAEISSDRSAVKDCLSDLEVLAFVDEYTALSQKG